MLLVPAGLTALESRAGRSSRAGALYEGAQEWQGDNVPLLHARAQELRRQGNQEVRWLWQAVTLCVPLPHAQAQVLPRQGDQEVRGLWQALRLPGKLVLYMLSWDLIPVFL